MTSAQTHTAEGRPRARKLAIPLPGQPGPLNAITDVPGVDVGEVTLIDGDGPLEVGRGPVRTGVTAILPRGRDGVGRACAAGWYSLNGNGEMTGTTWIEESGAFNVPVVLSNTHAIGACHTGVTSWINKVDPRLARQWLLPVCAETWDGYLNDINGGHVRPEHVEAALDAAAPGPVAEGSVGGGTGMNCYEFKGGNGTASRVVEYGAHTFTVGAFVQANFGSRSELTVAGRHVGPLLADDNPLDSDWSPRTLACGLPPVRVR
jgi:D-aminopeptidase